MEKVFTQNEAVLAYKALDKISGQEVSWKTAYWLMKLKKQLQGQFDFQRECEQKLFEKYHPVQENEQFRFNSTEDAQNFVKELDDIANIELTDLHIKPVEISENENLHLTVKDMEALDGFVEFQEEYVSELKIIDSEDEQDGNSNVE